LGVVGFLRELCHDWRDLGSRWAFEGVLPRGAAWSPQVWMEYEAAPLRGVGPPADASNDAFLVQLIERSSADVVLPLPESVCDSGGAEDGGPLAAVGAEARRAAAEAASTAAVSVLADIGQVRRFAWPSRASTLSRPCWKRRGPRRKLCVPERGLWTGRTGA
jgi:hypothetical protein